MKKVSAVIRPDRLDEVAVALERAGFAGFTISDVRGHGQSPSEPPRAAYSRSASVGSRKAMPVSPASHSQ